MPSYRTLAVLALAVSAVSPALSAPAQEIRGQALNRREPVKRGLGGGLFTKMGGALKNLALMSIVGGVSSEAGNAIYKSVSKPAADVVESGGSGAADGAVASGESAIPSTGELSTSSGSLSTAPTNGGPPPTTPPTTSGSQPLTSRSNGKPPGTASTASQDNSVNTAFSGAEWQNPSQKRALGHDLPVNLFARSVSDRNDLNRRTSLHPDLLSRADLEEALSLISRMLRVDELD